MEQGRRGREEDRVEALGAQVAEMRAQLAGMSEDLASLAAMLTAHLLVCPARAPLHEVPGAAVPPRPSLLEAPSPHARAS